LHGTDFTYYPLQILRVGANRATEASQLSYGTELGAYHLVRLTPPFLTSGADVRRRSKFSKRLAPVSAVPVNAVPAISTDDAAAKSVAEVAPVPASDLPDDSAPKTVNVAPLILNANVATSGNFPPQLKPNQVKSSALKKHHTKFVLASLATSALTLTLALGGGAAAVADEGPDFFETEPGNELLYVEDYSELLHGPPAPEIVELAEAVGAPWYAPPVFSGGLSEHVPEPYWEALDWDIDRGPNWTDRVLLTYDDCMSDPYRFIEVLDHATASNIGLLLFPTGNCITMYRNRFGLDLLEEIRSRGHWVGNHTISHPHLARVSRAEVARQIAWPETNILRPPFGSWNQMVYQVAAENGMRLMMWDLDTNDWRGPKAEQDIIDLVVTYAEPGNSVLMHFQHQAFTTNALSQIQYGLRARGIELCRPAPIWERPTPALIPDNIC